jgi:hypothetical protein
LAALVDNGHREIRIQALRVMPLVSPSGENRSAVLRALGDADSNIVMAAAAWRLAVFKLRRPFRPSRAVCGAVMPDWRALPRPLWLRFRHSGVRRSVKMWTEPVS